MSTEVDHPVHAPSPQFLDVTGLPASVIEGLRTIVASLREQHPAPPASTEPARATEQWISRLNAWIASQGVRVGKVRDDREAIYEVRGETDGEWVARLNDFIATQPVRSLTIADDRESIYEGCGE
ncbi:hypothetical protein [Paludisphaera sp.]|uniref:hypothetical protein n=1 Tax=Paludisphaera sp. TaxID=2017432 RepID=UPI00301CF615